MHCWPMRGRNWDCSTRSHGVSAKPGLTARIAQGRHASGAHPHGSDGTMICCFAWHADAAPASEDLHGVAPAAWQQADRKA